MNRNLIAVFVLTFAGIFLSPAGVCEGETIHADAQVVDRVTFPDTADLASLSLLELGSAGLGKTRVGTGDWMATQLFAYAQPDENQAKRDAAVDVAEDMFEAMGNADSQESMIIIGVIGLLVIVVILGS